jgi:hypothetical protein
MATGITITISLFIGCGTGIIIGWILCKKYGKRVKDAEDGLINIADKFKKGE